MLDVKPVNDEKIREFLMKQRQIPDYKAEVCAAFARGNVDVHEPCVFRAF